MAKRKLRNHPAVDIEKPSLVRREALFQELQRAGEAMRPFTLPEDVLTQWRESQKALKAAVETANLSKESKRLLKTSQQSFQVAADAMKQWKESLKALQAAMYPHEDAMRQWRESQKALRAAEESINQWRELQAIVSTGLKPVQLPKEGMIQWQQSQRALADLRKSLAPPKEFLQAINKAQEIVSIARRHEED